MKPLEVVIKTAFQVFLKNVRFSKFFSKSQQISIFQKNWNFIRLSKKILRNLYHMISVVLAVAKTKKKESFCCLWPGRRLNRKVFYCAFRLAIRDEKNNYVPQNWGTLNYLEKYWLKSVTICSALILLHFIFGASQSWIAGARLFQAMCSAESELK